MIIDPLFSFTAMTEAGKDKAQEIAKVFSKLLFDLEDILPGNSREFAIAKTKLEESAFFAKKALRNYKENVA
jgi:predicted transposase YdaD